MTEAQIRLLAAVLPFTEVALNAQAAQLWPGSQVVLTNGVAKLTLSDGQTMFIGSASATGI